MSVYRTTGPLVGGMLEIPDFFFFLGGGVTCQARYFWGLQSRCWGPAYVAGKSQSTIPLGSHPLLNSLSSKTSPTSHVLFGVSFHKSFHLLLFVSPKMFERKYNSTAFRICPSQNWKITLSQFR